MIYIAFLRAINVGGHTVKMVRLRELFTELGFTDVRTYIQTGNVFFATDETDRTVLTSRIERHLQAALGYPVGTLLRTIPEVERALALDPFKDVDVTPDIRLCIMFVSGPLPDDLGFPLASPKGDVEIVGVTGGEIFYAIRIVNGRPPDPTKFIEATCKVKSMTMTTRFFGTTAKILQAAREA